MATVRVLVVAGGGGGSAGTAGGVDVDLTIAGQWFYRFEGTGAVVAADEVAITAKATVF